MRAAVLGATLGFAVGVGAGAAIFGGETQVQVVEVEGTSTTRTVVERVEDTACADELRECRSQLRMQERVVEDHEGAWQDWPADVDPSEFEAAVEALDVAGELEHIECSEFPCVATFAIDSTEVPFSADDPNVPLTHLTMLAELLGGQTGVEGEVMTYPLQVHGDEVRSTVTFAVIPPDHDTPELRERLRYRMAAEAETALCINGRCD